jgi:hypothetical protein
LALGSITLIPAIKWFCIYAAVSIMADYLIIGRGLHSSTSQLNMSHF